MTSDVFSIEHPYFSSQEFADRVTRLKSAMLERQVDVIIIDEIEALTWIAGYGNSQNRWRCVVVPLDGEPFFLIRALDAPACAERTWIKNVISFADWEDPVLALAKRLTEMGLGQARIGMDWNSYSTSIARFNQIKEALSDATYVDVGALIWELRLVKSQAEIDLLSKASEIADAALLSAARVAKPGRTQRDLLIESSIAFIKGGAEPAHPGVITWASGDTFLHKHMSERPFVESDLIHLEVVPKYGGYSAREMRSISVGTPSAEMASIARNIAAIQDLQIEAMVPGASARDVDAILRKGLMEAGIRTNFENITGYTLGLYVTQGPRTSDFTRIFHPKADWMLEANQAFHMYIAAHGISLSETVVVTPDGARRLTKLPRGILSSDDA